MARYVLAVLSAVTLVACGSDSGGDVGGRDAGPDGAGQDLLDTRPDVATTDAGATDDQGGNDIAPLDCGGKVGTVQMGYGCEDDCDCEAGLVCYDEAYPGAQHVCTRDGGNCGPGFQYIQFSSQHWKKYTDMTLKNLCMPACTSLADCEKYGGIYTWCTGKTASYWEGQTLALNGHCQTTRTE